jgi:NADPH2:quinone reductase
MKAIRIHNYGGVEALRYENHPAPAPNAGEALIKIEAIGVNFIDIYHRTGLYRSQLPFTPGMEAAGTVAAIGPGVTEVSAGTRVAYCMSQGSYAEQALVPAWKLVPLPDSVDSKSGAALMLQGMTAHYLTHDSFRLQSGHTALVHAAAGGVGLLLVQIAKKLGATVFGTVGSQAKAELALAAGADAVILYAAQDFETEVKRLTGGRGVDVVYDSVAAATFERSLNCLRPRGYLVLFGQSSGVVPPLDPSILAAKGSLFLTRPVLAHYAATRDEVLSRAEDLLAWLTKGELKLRIGGSFALADAAKAQQELEGRRTTGKILLLP